MLAYLLIIAIAFSVVGISLIQLVGEYLFNQRGAKYFSSSALLFIAGVATMYGCAIAEDKKLVTSQALAGMFAESIKSIAPTVGVCVFGYMIGALFGTLNVAEPQAS